MSMQPIRRSVTVGLDPERAFRLFTEEMGSWWPVEMHSRAVDEFPGEDLKVERIEFQTHVGGLVLEYMSNGQALPWGKVLAWEPPGRFVLAWHPSSSERPPTEVEVRFTAGADRFTSSPMALKDLRAFSRNSATIRLSIESI